MPVRRNDDDPGKMVTSPAGYTETYNPPPGVDVDYVDDIQMMQGEIGWNTAEEQGQSQMVAEHEFNNHYRIVGIAGEWNQVANDFVEVTDIGTFEASIQTVNTVGWANELAGYDTPGQFHENTMMTVPGAMDVTNGAGAGGLFHERHSYYIIPELHFPQTPETVVPGTTHQAWSQAAQLVGNGISSDHGCGVQVDVVYYLEEIEEEDVEYSQHYRFQ